MDASRTSSALQLAHVAAERWERVQVELQGKYSIERMRAFHAYSSQTSWFRILLWCIITPVPCLVVNILLDVAPLAPPSAGRDANYVFWVRLTAFFVVIDYWVLMQIRHLTPTLGMTRWHALSTTVVVAVACTITDYVLAGFIPMPIPFVLLTASPAFFVAITIIFGIYFGRKLMNDGALRASFNRASFMIDVQFCLILLYPAFIYGFNSISPKYQSPYMIIIPVVKIVAKNIMSKPVGSNHDFKPVQLIFNVDCFNAIHVSLAMQHATTILTSLIVMLIDITQLISRLPVDHPLHVKSFLEVVMLLDQGGDHISCEKQTSCSTLSGPPPQTNSVAKPKESKTGLTTSNKVFVLPHEATSRRTASNTYTPPNLCSSESRVAFLDATRKLLFTTDFVILVEYTEVIMPVFYSLIMAATYHLPNRAFYCTIADIDEQNLWSMITSVLMYIALELISLIVMDLMIRHITGVSAMRQVGFVLSTQVTIVQSKLLSWVLYAVQISLVPTSVQVATLKLNWVICWPTIEGKWVTNFIPGLFSPTFSEFPIQVISFEQ